MSAYSVLKAGSPIWLSLHVLNLNRAKTFYTSVLNWHIKDSSADPATTDEYPPDTFAMFGYPDNRLHEAGMGGGSLALLSKPEEIEEHEKLRGNRKGVISWFFVDDVEETLKKVEKYGGKRLGEVIEEGKSTGMMSHFEDSEGNVLGVYMFRKQQGEKK